MSDSKLLSIVGPTAVGKTTFALQLAELFQNCDLLVADSRQVYQGLEVVSGADIPADFTLANMDGWDELSRYFHRGTNRLFGVSLIKPSESWSVSTFQEYALRVCQMSWQEHRLPIVVGGTGLYHAHLLNPDQLLHVKPNLEFRAQAADMSITQLQELLQEKDHARYSGLNNSDRHNPRRLIRAIEQAIEPSPAVSLIDDEFSKVSKLTIGLTDAIEAIEDRITQRVCDRISNGAVQEVERLLDAAPDRQLPVWSATGIKPLIALATGQIDHIECEQLWTRQERQYAKRQLTWWKKQPDVSWYQLSEPNWQARAQAQIEAWYQD